MAREIRRGVDELGFPDMRYDETIEVGCPECHHAARSGPLRHTVLGRDGSRELIECGNPACYHQFVIEVAK